jgi:hypothetical protein
MPSIFYKQCRDIVGDWVTDEFLDVLRGGDICKVLNG